MANCIAKAIGSDKSRDKEVHRLGSENAWAQAATWSTFATAYVNKDGSGFTKVTRNGNVLHHIAFGPENRDGKPIDATPKTLQEQFEDWLDTDVIADLIIEDLKEDGQEVHFDRMKEVWLSCLEDLHHTISSCI